MIRRMMAILLAMCLLAAMPFAASAEDEELVFTPNDPTQEKGEEDKTEMDELED